MPSRTASNGRLLEHIILLVNLVELRFPRVHPRIYQNAIRGSKGGASRVSLPRMLWHSHLGISWANWVCGPLQWFYSDNRQVPSFHVKAMCVSRWHTKLPLFQKRSERTWMNLWDSHQFCYRISLKYISSSVFILILNCSYTLVSNINISMFLVHIKKWHCKAWCWRVDWFIHHKDAHLF